MVYRTSCRCWFLASVVLTLSQLTTIEGQISLSSVPCGQQQQQQRIVGGFDSSRGQITYIASLTKRGGHFCGASIVNERWLLTAGHCICSGTNKVLRPNQIRAVLGLYRMSEFSGNRIDPVADPAYDVGIRTIVPHPGYSCGKTSNDIALLEVTERIYFTPTVRPVCLSSGADASARVDGVTATVAGWGWQQENRQLGDKADTLQRAVVDVFRNEECESMYRRGNRSRTIARTQLCAGKSVGGVDACWADSGGPLVTSNNVLIGIVSTGIGCARPGFPGIYTRVSEYAGWIVTVIERFNARR